MRFSPCWIVSTFSFCSTAFSSAAVDDGSPKENWLGGERNTQAPFSHPLSLFLGLFVSLSTSRSVSLSLSLSPTPYLTTSSSHKNKSHFCSELCMMFTQLLCSHRGWIQNLFFFFFSKERESERWVGGIFLLTCDHTETRSTPVSIMLPLASQVIHNSSLSSGPPCGAQSSHTPEHLAAWKNVSYVRRRRHGHWECEGGGDGTILSTLHWPLSIEKKLCC